MGSNRVDELKAFIEGVAVPLVLSLAGGIAKVFREGFKSWQQFAGSLVLSGFAGTIVHLLIQDVDISSNIKAALVGLSGYSGGAILDEFSCRLQKSVEKLPHLPWDGVDRRKNRGGG